MGIQPTTGNSYPDDFTSQTMNGSVIRATTEVATYSQLMVFCQWYQAIHGYVCIIVCLFGIAANVMNIIVLTRRNMVRLSILTNLGGCVV